MKSKILNILAVFVILTAFILPLIPMSVGATVYSIAASNSSGGDKATATAVCSGTNDQTTINTYLTAGNTVMLYAGTYNIGGNITVASNTHLYGVGITSIINSTNGGISIANASNVQLDHIKITGTVNRGIINSAVWIDANSTNVSTISVHDITATSLNSDHFDIETHSYSVSSVTFANITSTSPDGMGFCNLGYGVSANNIISGVIYYNCNVTNAGVAVTRDGAWITGFDLGEGATGSDSLTVNNMYVIHCSVNGALESDFHMENFPTYTNTVFTGNTASWAGLKDVGYDNGDGTHGVQYGYGYLINGDVIAYNNTPANNNYGGDMIVGGIVHTPIIDSVSGSAKTAANVTQSNCKGVVITTSANHYELVLYSSDGSAVSQTLTLPNGNTYPVSFSNYDVETGVTGSAPTTTTSTTTTTTSTYTVTIIIKQPLVGMNGVNNSKLTVGMSGVNFDNILIDINETGTSHNVSSIISQMTPLVVLIYMLLGILEVIYLVGTKQPPLKVIFIIALTIYMMIALLPVVNSFAQTLMGA